VEARARESTADPQQNLKLAKLLRVAAYGGILSALAAQIIAIVEHFATKVGTRVYN
jgi:hypothetical protein